MRITIGAVTAMLLMLGGCRARDPAPEVGFYTLDSARISGATSVTSPTAGWSDLSVLVTVDAGGNVIAARPVDNRDKLDSAPGLAAIRQWKFQPQRFDGKAVVAIGRVAIAYRQPELGGDTHVPFPAAAAPGDTEITLERGACYGSCPDYRVTVRGDGLVRFTTDSAHFAGQAAAVHLAYSGNNVLLPGEHIAQIDPAAAGALLDRFRKAHFFGLKDAYVAPITDNPTQRLTVRVGSKRKTVIDYVGLHAGMPHIVKDLEEAVDTVAGAARWVDGNSATIAYLEQQHFDFRSRDAVLLAAAAARRLAEYHPPTGVSALISGLIGKGVPLGGRIGDGTLGMMLVRTAATAGDETLFARLAERGQLAAMTRDQLNRAFVQVGCSPVIASALVKAGAAPRFAQCEGNALSALNGFSAACDGDESKLVAMAKTLLALGVPVDARNSLGWTLLMGCDSPALARLLIRHGANPNARDEEGTTAVLSTDDDRVALILLRAGADPRVRNDRGSLRQQAITGHMPATLVWLDAHGVR